MSKGTIVFERGDTFTHARGGTIFQWRGNQCWWMLDPEQPVIPVKTPGESDLHIDKATTIAEALGYTVVRNDIKAEESKPDTPHHFKCPRCYFVCAPDSDWTRRMRGCKHEDALVRVEGSLPRTKPAPEEAVVPVMVKFASGAYGFYTSDEALRLKAKGPPYDDFTIITNWRCPACKGVSNG